MPTDQQQKTCNRCHRSLAVGEFYAKRGSCKACVNERNRKYRQANREEINGRIRELRQANPERFRAHDRKRNREKVNDRRRKWYQANPKKHAARQLNYFHSHREEINELRRELRQANLEKEREKARNWAKANPEKVRDHRRKRFQANPEKEDRYRRESHQRLKENPIYRLIRACRSRITKALRGRDKSARTQELIGCTWEKLRAHIESQFTKGMHWNNRGFGPGKWNVEHEKPFALFPNLTPKEQKIVCNWRNLRPMWSKKNLKKGGKWTRHSASVGMLTEVSQIDCRGSSWRCFPAPSSPGWPL